MQNTHENETKRKKAKERKKLAIVPRVACPNTFISYRATESVRIYIDEYGEPSVLMTPYPSATPQKCTVHSPGYLETAKLERSKKKRWKPDGRTGYFFLFDIA